MNEAKELLRTKYRGFDKDINPIYTEDSIIKAMKNYANLVAKHTLEDAANNARIQTITECDESTFCLRESYVAIEGYAETETMVSVNKQSILNTEIKTP